MGTFSSEGNAGLHSHIFQPPRTPSVSQYLQRSTLSLASQDADQSISRKRSRSNSYESNNNHAASSLHLTHGQFNPETPGALSPAPFVNTRYALAGGLDTPTTALGRGTDYAMSPDLAVRGRGWRSGNSASPDSYFPQLAREGNGRARQRRPTQSNGWGKTVSNAFGVAGKVLEICKAPFRGFYAGGGPGYRLQPHDDVDSMGQSCSEMRDVWKSLEKSTLVPGGFPDEDFIPDYMSRDHTTPPRAAKRLQTEKGGDLNASWIMVGETPISRESSPTRIAARKVPSRASPGRRPVSRAGQRPILPASRPSLTSFAGSPALRSGRPASFAPSRSPMASPKRESPASADVQRHAARMRKQELEDAANLKRFNQQLKAMIKEGKQALGTKIEVQDEFDSIIDEGYEEGT